MQNKNLLFSAIVLSSLFLFSCEKEPATTNNNNNSDPCASKNITVATTVTDVIKCETTGVINVNASGSTGFTYKLNSGAFQSGATFSNLGAGTYTITVKDVDGCTKTATATVAETGTKGPLFNDVTSLVTLKCNLPCHASGAGGATKGIMATDCDIISRKTLMNQKVVNENMGSLNNTEKAKLQAWIDAGGKYTD
ncbi:MAG TPA: hypothetical protein VGF79_14340 [Bacteroidia bacterium]